MVNFLCSNFAANIIRNFAVRSCEHVSRDPMLVLTNLSMMDAMSIEYAVTIPLL